MSKTDKQGIKALAAQAKRRLISGYWKNYAEEKEKAKESAILKGQNLQAVDEYFKSKFLNEDKKPEQNQDDFILYQKVCHLLESDEDTINPIGQLIDKEKFSALDEGNKQRYILQLSSKYKEMSERYFKEKERNQLKN